MEYIKKTFQLIIDDDLKYEKLLDILSYICIYCDCTTIYISDDELYIQVQNNCRNMLFDIKLPSYYWFDDYYFNHSTILSLNINIKNLYNYLLNCYPSIITIYYDLNYSNNLFIDSKNHDNIQIATQICMCELVDYYSSFPIEQLLDIPNNDKYQYYLVINNQTLKNIIIDIYNTNQDLIIISSSKTNEIILRTDNKLFEILDNNNSDIEVDDFILKFDNYLLYQLPIDKMNNSYIFIFIDPNKPIKFSFPLDQCDNDEYIDFNIHISPNNIYLPNNLDIDDSDDIHSLMDNLKI